MARGGSWSDRWNRIRSEFTLQDLCVDASGKALVGLGLGAWLAPWLQRYAWLLMVMGIALSAMVKAKYWKRFWT